MNLNPFNSDTSHIVMGLLKYFKGFECLHEAKEKIEIKCHIEKNLKFWKIEKIKQAWDEAEKITNKSDKKHWAYVIMLQMMTHLHNECVGQAEQNSRTGSSEHNQIESIGAESGGQHSTFNETDDVSENPSKEKLQKDDGTGEMDLEKSNSQTVYIKIPLSALSHSELTGVDHVSSPYKFIEGYPPDRPNTELRGKKHYVMSYNKDTKNAEWVYEILNESTLARNHIGLGLGKFMQIEDDQDDQDLQQGHLAAAANHSWCQEAYNSTFCFSNISPQAKILNTHIWRTLENVCRKKKNTKKNIHVYTGPVYTPPVYTPLTEDDSGPVYTPLTEDDSGPVYTPLTEDDSGSVYIPLTEDDSGSSGDEESQRKIHTKEKRSVQQIKSKKKKISDGGSENVKAVPTHFFKVIIVENDDGTVEEPECYLIPNDKEELSSFKDFKDEEQIKNEEILKTNFKKTLEHIERLSGLKFTAETCKNGEEDSIKTVEWKGEGRNGELTPAAINVRISTPHT